jgi:hypothetical protein
MSSLSNVNREPRKVFTSVQDLNSALCLPGNASHQIASSSSLIHCLPFSEARQQFHHTDVKLLVKIPAHYPSCPLRHFLWTPS